MKTFRNLTPTRRGRAVLAIADIAFVAIVTYVTFRFCLGAWHLGTTLGF